MRKILALVALFLAIPAFAQEEIPGNPGSYGSHPTYAMDLSNAPGPIMLYSAWDLGAANCGHVVMQAGGHFGGNPRCIIIMRHTIAMFRLGHVNGQLVWILGWSDVHENRSSNAAELVPGAFVYGVYPQSAYSGQIGSGHWAITNSLPSGCLSHFNECAW